MYTAKKVAFKMEEAFTWQQKTSAWIQVWKSPKLLCMQSAL